MTKPSDLKQQLRIERLKRRSLERVLRDSTLSPQMVLTITHRMAVVQGRIDRLRKQLTPVTKQKTWVEPGTTRTITLCAKCGKRENPLSVPNLDYCQCNEPYEHSHQ